jgi:DNA-binding MarR family transcriptional regulator
VPLNIRSARSDARRRLANDVLEELTAWNPRDRRQAFKSWLAGSLSLVHLHVLTILESDGPLSMSHLADALDVSVASATGIVDRMEQRNLVERLPDVDDRRLVVVHMREAGAEIFKQLAEHRRQSLIRLLDRLSARELQGLRIGLRALRMAREAEAAASVAPALGSVGPAAASAAGVPGTPSTGSARTAEPTTA